jgi:hypothetical protein
MQTMPQEYQRLISLLNYSLKALVQLRRRKLLLIAQTRIGTQIFVQIEDF